MYKIAYVRITNLESRFVNESFRNVVSFYETIVALRTLSLAS